MPRALPTCNTVVDLNTGDELLELEHETRTIRHFQYMKHVAWEASL